MRASIAALEFQNADVSVPLASLGLLWAMECH